MKRSGGHADPLEVDTGPQRREHPAIDAMMGEHFLDRNPNAGKQRGRPFSIAAALIIFILCAINVALLIVSARKLPPFNPLGDYPIQVVALQREDIRHNGDPLPTLRYVTGREMLPVRGIKCNESGEDVTVVGVTRWRLIEPPGTFIEAGRGQGTRKTGCQAFEYQNPIPEAVKPRLQELHETGWDVSEWQIVGEDDPVSPYGESGVPRYWHTENFIITFEAKTS